jgi:hypothetical protein
VRIGVPPVGDADLEDTAGCEDTVGLVEKGGDAVEMLEDVAGEDVGGGAGSPGPGRLVEVDEAEPSLESGVDVLVDRNGALADGRVRVPAPGELVGDVEPVLPGAPNVAAAAEVQSDRTTPL